MAKDKKVIAIYRLMEKFLSQKEIDAYDKELLDEFECSSKTLSRYLENIETLYPHIIKIKKGKKSSWKLISVSDIFEEFVNNSYDLYTLFEMAREFDPEIFKELEKGTLKKLASKDSTFLFKNPIMETIDSQNIKEIFKTLKDAVKNREYIDIIYNYEDKELYKNAKPLKLVFIDNNWYIAIVSEDEFKFLRLSFIKSVQKSKDKKRFSTTHLNKYLNFLKDAQNSLSFIDKEPKIATIKANANIAKYFKKGMKKFLPSQKFIKELDDGSVLFTVEYTQDLEVLPLIQKWLPDLIIESPKELKDAFKAKLEKALSYIEQN